jgi:hypothetical protein
MQDVPNHSKFAAIRTGAHFVICHEPSAPVLSTTHEQSGTFWKIGCLIFHPVQIPFCVRPVPAIDLKIPCIQQGCNKLYPNIYEIVDDCDGEKTRG